MPRPGACSAATGVAVLAVGAVVKLGVKQLETLQIMQPRSFLIVAGKGNQRQMDRLVDLGLAKYPPPSKASGKKTAGDGGFAVITSKGLAVLEAEGLWPHPFSERPEPRDARARVESNSI